MLLGHKDQQSSTLGIYEKGAHQINPRRYLFRHEVLGQTQKRRECAQARSLFKHSLELSVPASDHACVKFLSGIPRSTENH